MKIVENKKDCNVPNPVFKIFLFEKILKTGFRSLESDLVFDATI